MNFSSVRKTSLQVKVKLRFLGKAGLFEIHGAVCVPAGSKTFELRHGCMIFIGNTLIFVHFYHEQSTILNLIRRAIKQKAYR